MSTKKKTIEAFSLRRKLRKQKKTDHEFEMRLNRLSLEEIISLKMNLIYDSVGDKAYGFHIFKNLEHVIKESIIKSTLSYCSSYESARRHLGLDIDKWTKLLRKYVPMDYLTTDKDETELSEEDFT